MDGGISTINMEKAHMEILKVIFTMAGGKIIKSMVKAHLLLLLKSHTNAFGKMTN
jgi:hypothetical protein